MHSDVRLLQLSDPHLFADPSGALRGVNTLESLRRVLRQVADRNLNFEAVVCTGDIVNDEPGGYAHFARELGALGKPIYCIPGNHDEPALLRRMLAQPPFQVGGHVDIGAWRIVLIDSCVPGQAGGHLSDAELQRLDAALADDQHFAMVCVHHHPVPMASRWLDALGIDNAEALFKVLDAHSQVRLISWGHVHQCFDERRRGVRLLATPSTGGQFLPLAANFALDSRPPAFRRLTLRADGTVDTEVIWVDELAGASGRASAY
jgi:3',5'-cyclic-AMP phosphodiesterase